MIFIQNKSAPAIFIFLICLSLNNLQAQNKYNFKEFYDESKILIERPVHWNTGDWFTTAGVLWGTYAVMHLDETIKCVVLKNRNYVTSIPMVFGKIYGEWYTQLILGTVFFVHGSVNNNSKNKKVGFEILQSSAYVIGITGILKFSFGRSRPYTGAGPFDFHPFSFEGDDFLSLNSGHTSLAFSLSTVLAANIKPTGLKILAFIPAFLTGISRVYDNEHWASDVFLGAFIGYFMGKFVTELHNNNEKLFGTGQHGTPLIQFSIPF